LEGFFPICELIEAAFVNKVAAPAAAPEDPLAQTMRALIGEG
jgi:hypothetical protein